MDELDAISRREAGERLRKARKAAGLSTVAVAAKLGLSESAVRNTENGTNGMPMSKAARYAEVVGVSAAWLAFGRNGADERPLAAAPKLTASAALLAVQGLMDRAECAPKSDASQLKELAVWLSKRAFA